MAASGFNDVTGAVASSSVQAPRHLRLAVLITLEFANRAVLTSPVLFLPVTSLLVQLVRYSVGP
jgi:hypothetical protein